MSGQGRLTLKLSVQTEVSVDSYVLEQAYGGSRSNVALYWNLCRSHNIVDNGFPKDVCPDVSADVCVVRIDKNGQRTKWIPNAGRVPYIELLALRA